MSASSSHTLISSPSYSSTGRDKHRIGGHFVVREQLNHRIHVSRHLAWDESTDPRRTVQIIRTTDGNHRTDQGWHRLDWEEALRHRVTHPSFPQLIARINDESGDYLALELPEGSSLWDAWDDPGVNPGDKFNWLIQIAELLKELHAAGAILDGLRPDQIVVTDDGRAVLVDGTGLLPMPLPRGTPIVATRTTAPELLNGSPVDARADLYCFGAMIHSLVLGRELTEGDFFGEGRPIPFLERFPDVHPLLGRLIAKTFSPERHQRFPSHDAIEDDPTGFIELIATLEHCQKILGRARLDIASWSSTGIFRHGNEDTFAVMHSSAGLGDTLGDSALVLLSDGMGGSAAGEVAAAIAVQDLHQSLSSLMMTPASLTKKLDLLTDPAVEETQYYDRTRNSLVVALKQANRTVHRAGMEGIGHRGMGCTAEAIFTDGRRLLVGHVGDSRTYHFHRGQLTQLTRDHTYVSQLVEYGEITAEEAEYHPRRAELQQALGGWAEVEPDVIDVPIETGDWIVVCSDGLSGVVKPHMMLRVLERATSADDAARRLANLANHQGAPDNVTVAVIRAV